MKRMWKIFKKIDILLIIGIAIINLSLAFNDSLWGDEAYTMLILKKNFKGIINATAIDVHPPLYYFIAKIFTIIFGYSVTSVKVSSIVPVILSMIFVNIKSKRLFKNEGSLISILFSLLIGLCPVAFSINLELRMYTWAMLFVTCSGIYTYELYKNQKSKKKLLMFILTSLCAAYTHYYAALTECFIYLFLIVALLISDRKNWKLCLIFIVLTIIGYIPWLPIFIRQFLGVKNGWWLESINSDILLVYIRYLFDGEFTNIFLFLITLIFIEIFSKIKEIKNDSETCFAICAIFSFILTIFVAVLISKLIRPMFIERYMYPAAGLFFLGISIFITKSDYKKLLMNFMIGLIFINMPFSYNKMYKREYKNGTEDFKEFARNNISLEETISTDISHFSWSMLPYYLPNNEIISNIDKNTRGYVITYKSEEEVKEIIKDFNVKSVYSGNIDFYNFNIYYID